MCVCVCVCDASRVAIDSKHVRVSQLETRNVLFFGTNLLDRFGSVAPYQKKDPLVPRRGEAKREIFFYISVFSSVSSSTFGNM